MKQDLKPTRAELRDVKRKLAVVRRGHRLLKRKQESLMVEFHKGLREYRRSVKETAAANRDAAGAVTRAEMASGRMGVWSYALTRAGRAGVEIGRSFYMGVSIPDLRHVLIPGAVSGLLPGEPPQNIEAANACEALLLRLVALAAAEGRLRVILAEIERTKRRVNALELKVIPQLEQDSGFIQAHLDEQEREGLFTLKRIRSKIRAAG